MTALIDLDALIYRSCFACKEDFICTIESLEFYIGDIILSTKCDNSRLILSGHKNLRKEISPLYKANRTQLKPRYHSALREYSINFLGAEVAPEGLEADDYLGILQNDETFIVSEDKDMMQIKGLHYRLTRKWENYFTTVSEYEGIQWFFRQLLWGDVSDNIKGIDGIGEVKSMKILKDKTPKEMYDTVLELYEKNFPNGYEVFDTNSRLLWILKDTNKTYTDYI